MESKTYLVWASGTDAQKQAPSSALMAKGWIAEQPAFEHFNWLFNRIDTRLSTLEQPRTSSLLSSPSRAAVINAGDEFTVPPYTKGNGSLEVYLGGILAFNAGDGGRDLDECQYIEQDPVGGNTASTTIKFLQAIPEFLSIDAKAWTQPTNEVPTDMRYGTETFVVSIEGQVITIDGTTQKAAIISTIKDYTLKADPLPNGYVKRVLLVLRNELANNAASHKVTLDGIEGDTFILTYGQAALCELCFMNGKVFLYKIASGDL